MSVGAQPVTKQTLDRALQTASQAIAQILEDPGNVVVRCARFLSTHDQAALEALPSSDGTPYTPDEAFAAALFGNMLAQVLGFWHDGTAVPASATTPASLAAKFDTF